MSITLFIEPMDVLYLRGNRLFGGAGDDASALMPPRPSVAAGAIRTKMMMDQGVHPRDFLSQPQVLLEKHPELAKTLGRPEKPGTFQLQRFLLAQKKGDLLEPLINMPSDLYIPKREAAKDEQSEVLQLKPGEMPEGILTGNKLEMCPLLEVDKQTKAEKGFFLNASGLRAYMNGEKIDGARDIVSSSKLWKTDHRLGIALNNKTGTAEEGRIYTTDTVDLDENIGFLAQISGADKKLFKPGLLRFGGDGRAAHISEMKISLPEPDWQKIENSRSFRLFLSSPGIFPGGWRLPGMDSEFLWKIDDSNSASARCVSAAISGFEVVSGWDQARGRPKTSCRAVPAGSVWFFKDFKGDLAVLKSLLARGLRCEEKSRQVEGFNHFFIAPWPAINS